MWGMPEGKTMDKEQVEKLEKEAKAAREAEAEAIARLIKAAGGAVILDISKAGVKYAFVDGRGGAGTATGRRAMVKAHRSHSLFPPEISISVSPQAQGNFYPHKMSLVEFKAAMGEAFDEMFLAAVKIGIEQSKKTAEHMSADDEDKDDVYADLS